MRHLVWLLLVVGCGEVKSRTLADAPPSAIDARSIDGPPLAIDAPPLVIDAQPIDGSPMIDAAACATYNDTWVTSAITFDSQIAPTASVDFETRGDGVTGVTAGTPVPRDEYLACCGIRLDYLGPAGGQLIWAGNAAGGFEVRASCPGVMCNTTSGVRITFIPTVTAVGIDYPGGDDAAMFGAQGNLLSTMSVMGSGTSFLGYQSAVRIDHAEFTDSGGENIEKLLYHRCP